MVQDRSRRKDGNKGKASVKKQGGIGETHRDIPGTGVKRRDMNEHVFPRPDGLRENAETAISCREPGPAERRKRYTSTVAGRRN